MGTRDRGFKKITHDTLIPLSLIGAIAYVIFLVGSGYQQLNANTLAIGRMQIDDKESVQMLRLISERLSRIEATLEVLLDKQGR
jgi:hypothetical protein